MSAQAKKRKGMQHNWLEKQVRMSSWKSELVREDGSEKYLCRVGEVLGLKKIQGGCGVIVSWWQGRMGEEKDCGWQQQLEACHTMQQLKGSGMGWWQKSKELHRLGLLIFFSWQIIFFLKTEEKHSSERQGILRKVDYIKMIVMANQYIHSLVLSPGHEIAKQVTRNWNKTSSVISEWSGWKKLSIITMTEL